MFRSLHSLSAPRTGGGLRRPWAPSWTGRGCSSPAATSRDATALRTCAAEARPPAARGHTNDSCPGHLCGGTNVLDRFLDIPWMSRVLRSRLRCQARERRSSLDDAEGVPPPPGSSAGAGARAVPGRVRERGSAPKRGRHSSHQMHQCSGSLMVRQSTPKSGP